MPNKRIQDLTPASSVQLNDLFVLEQSGAAMSVSGQILVRDLAAALDGHGGINNISYTPPESPSLDGTLTVTTADGTEYPFDVTNGRGISSITWTTSGTAGNGMIHTGTILYNDGTTSTVQFQDGIQGLQGVQTYVWIMWAQNYPSSDSDMQNIPSDYIGIYTGTASSAPTSYEAYTWYDYKGDRGEPGDYIEPVVSYGTSIAAATEPSTWYSSPTSISYAAGNFIWRKTEYVLHDEQTVQATATEIIGYIGQNGSGSGTVTQITVNGTVYTDDGTGNVSMNLDPEDVGAIADPSTKSNGQVLTYDSVAGEWVAATPSTGNVNTVNNVGPTAGTTNVQLYATAIPMSSSDSTSIANAIPVASDVAAKPLGTAAAGTNALFSRSDHIHPMPTAANVGAVSTSDVQYKIYDSVSDLGLTSGSATISGAWTALRAVAPAMLICPSSEFASAQRPEGNSYGTMVIAVSYSDDSVARGWVEFHGYGSGVGDYRMFLSNSTPSGTWERKTAPTLLWTNSSPTSDFAAQTVSISLSNFTCIMVEFRVSKSYSTRTPIMEVEINSSQTFCQSFYNVTGSGLSSLLNRSVTASSTGVAFSDCYIKSMTATSASTDNSKMIPTQIYGV